MSQSVRQSNLFAGEDFTKIYKSFKNVDFRAYDYDTLKAALIENIKTFYPEDFNDFIESSEYVAIIELLAFLGSSLSFRTDLNSRENFLDTAQRRDSIIRLARMLNYQPKRNVAASGMFKLSAIQTSEPITDSLGRELSNTTIFWNDANNPDSYEQFILILNAALNSINKFGNPFKRGTIGGIPTELYQMNNVRDLEVAYSITASLTNGSYPFDIVNPDFEDNQYIYERHPDPSNAFHVIYRNDGNGLGSSDTGFFLYFKQGELQKTDNVYDLPEENRITNISIDNINENDVYVQEIDENGDVLEKWEKVPSLTGNNVIFNSLNLDVRNIFSVITQNEDRIQLKFADGNFGNVPTGIFRTWTRTSANENLIVRPEDVRGQEISIPYIGVDGQEHFLRLIFNLENTVSNGAVSETDEDIKERAPQVFYSQNRMVNNEDYNVFPLNAGSQMLKVRTINRTYAGHSRFIDINDPTGFHNNVLLFSEDGSLYKEFAFISAETNVNLLTTTDIIFNDIENFMTDTVELRNFYYDEYMKQYLDINPGAFDISTGDFWVTIPNKSKNNTGYLRDVASPELNPLNNAIDLNDPVYKFIKEGAKLRFEHPTDSTKTEWVTVQAIENNGVPYDPRVSETGPIHFNSEVQNGWVLKEVIPAFRTVFTNTEKSNIFIEIENQNIFGLGYDLDLDEWYTITANNINVINSFDLATAKDNSQLNADSSWLTKVEYIVLDQDTTQYVHTVRGTRYVFESYEDIRFFYNTNQRGVDVETGKALQDEIVLVDLNKNVARDDFLGKNLVWNIHDSVILNDGYIDQRKVQVKPADTYEDGVPDDPMLFEKFVGPDDKIFFEKFEDFDGYEYFRPWVAYWYDLRAETISTITFDNTNVDLVNCDLILILAGQQADLETEITNNPTVFEGKYVNIDFTFYKITGGVLVTDDDHYARHGRSFTLDSNAPASDPVIFKWNHFAPKDNRIDPSISNIMDMYVLTNAYYTEVQKWKINEQSLSLFPESPTTEELRVQFSDLDEYKMLSDHIIYNSANFKLIFGSRARDEYKAKFKVIKLPTTFVSDNEIKSKVIESINEYFDINNWDFGESFYFTELSAYIHQKLANIIASVVIVPTNSSSEFGDLFQIKAEPNELFLSTATVADVEIISNLTDVNLRK